MGAWGYAIFSDDEACDVRDQYRELIGDGLDGPAATQQVLKEYADSLGDPDSGPVIWLALAATQWKCGRLEDEIKAKALEIIDTGAGMALWEEQGQQALKKRQAALAKLREQLVSPQPPVKRIPKRFRSSTDLQPGDVISYRLRSGNYILLKVLKLHTDSGGTNPEFVILNWHGRQIPSPWRISLMRQMPSRTRWSGKETWQIAAVKAGEYPADRIEIVAHGMWVGEVRGQLHVTLWRLLDACLEKDYGLT